MEYRTFRQLPTTQQWDQLNSILMDMDNNPKFHLLLDHYIEMMRPDDSLVGKELEVDVYRKACMREGLQFLKSEAIEANAPSLIEE